MEVKNVQVELFSVCAHESMNIWVHAGLHVCVCVLILDVAAGKESLWRVTEQLIISHSVPHTVEWKRGGVV